MAKARIVKRSKQKQGGRFTQILKSIFFPEWLQAFLARRIVDITAASVFAAGFFLAISLATYHTGDPSWNTAAFSAEDGSAITQNLAGYSGAVLADLFMQTLGLASFLIAFCVMAWGVRIYTRVNMSPIWLRALAFLSMPFLGALALAQIPAQDFIIHPFMGSSVGTALFEQARSLTHADPSTSFLLQFIPGLSGFLALCFFAFAAGLQKAEARIIGRFIKACVLWTAYGICRAGYGFFAWIRRYNEPALQADGFEREFRNPFESMPNFLERLKPKAELPDFEIQDYDEPEAEKPKAKRAPVVSQPEVGETKKKPAAKPQSKQSKLLLSADEDWELPSVDLLDEVPEKNKKQQHSPATLQKNAEFLSNVLADFSINGDIVSISPGPVVTMYELEPAPGTKSSRVISLSDDIARSMSAVSVRCAVVPGRNVIGIELPNKARQVVYLREILESKAFERNKAGLPLILGKDIGGNPVTADLAKMPHLLVAGTTGSGKSVAVNTMILSLLYTLPPSKCRFIMIDPKMLELSIYDDIPHLLCPVVTEPTKAIVSLKWAVAEMENRYRAMSKLGVRNIDGYNQRLAQARKKGETIMQKVQTGFDPETGDALYEEQEMDLTELPYIVVVVDEFADLMLVAGKDVENAIQRLAQMARAAGIHLIMATQRPSVDVITGVIKANFPTRISFSVTSKIDSRTILGEGGAEQLLGMGDMLYMAPGGRITRVHGPFVSDEEVEGVVNHLKAQATPDYIDAVTSGEGIEASDVMDAMFGDGGSGDGSDVDELYDKAVAIVAREGKASTSFIQRHLQIGYNRAARIIEEMERQGVVSKASPTGKREILISDFSDA